MSGSKSKKREKKAKKAKKAPAKPSAKKPSKPLKAKVKSGKPGAKPVKKPVVAKPVVSKVPPKDAGPKVLSAAVAKTAAVPPKKGGSGSAADAKAGDTGAAGAEEPIVNPYGASDEAVEEAGEALGVVFPKMAIRIWKAINGGEINDWKFHPLREPSAGVTPKGDIVSANTDNRPEDMPDEWITLAEQDGNHLVLEKEDDRLLPDLLLWDHDSGEVDAYSDELANFAEEAEELRDELLRSRRR